jgi:hypothetical protein
MGTFNKLKRSRKSSHLDEKIKFLNKELKKTGVVCEAAPANSTAGIYNIIDFTEGLPEIISDVPDSTGFIAGTSTQDANGGDESTSSTWDTGWNNVSDMQNSNDLNGESNRNIPFTPDLSGWNGTSTSANAAVIFGGTRSEGQTQPTTASGIAVYSGDQGQKCIGSVGAGNKFVQILVGDAVFGTYAYPGTRSGYYGSYSESEFAAAQNIASAYEANKNKGSVSRKVWVPFNTANNGVGYAAYTGAKKTTTLTTSTFPDGFPQQWALKSISFLTGQRQQYISQNSTPNTSTVIFSTGLDDGEYYPGPLSGFMDFLRGALGVGAEALDWLFKNQIDQFEDYFTGSEDSEFKEIKDLIADWNPFTITGDVEWAIELAASAVMDTPVVRTENDISQSDLDKVYNQVPIENVIIGPIDMIVADGNVFYNPETKRIESNHIDPTLPDGDQPGQRQHADNLKHPDLSTDIGKNEYGYVNPLASEGKGTIIFDPETGQSRLVNFTYYNIDTTDKETEDPQGFGDMFINFMSAIGIDVSGNNPHTGGMAGIPQNLLGMKFTNAVSNNSNLPAQYVNLMNAQAGILNQNYEPQGELIKEGWESPKHTYIDKDQQKRWFKEKDVAPIYPKKAPPKLVRGYHPDMLPKLDTPIPQIKVKAKDLIRSYKLKKVEAQAWIYKIERLNDYIARNPDMLAYARERYPKSDPHLAALNYKMDMQLAAADEYIEKQFPENIRLYNKVLAATKKSIKLTDPKTFKSEKGVFTTFNKLARVQHVDTVYQPKERTLKLKKRTKNSVNRFLFKPKEKTKDDILKDKLAVLDKEMQKTMPDKV